MDFEKFQNLLMAKNIKDIVMYVCHHEIWGMTDEEKQKFIRQLESLQDDLKDD